MDIFTGGDADEIITPAHIPATVALSGMRHSSDDDLITGGTGADTLDGGRGDDTIDGGLGADLLSGGAGEDIFVWNPGDGGGTIDGGRGDDTLLLRTANVAEQISVLDFGGHAVVTRAGDTLDLDNVEHLRFGGSGGADTFFIAGLEGTDVERVDIDLGLAGGAGDGAVDTVSAIGGATRDRVVIGGTAETTTAKGLSAVFSVHHGEAMDRFVINTLDGDDVLDASDFGGGVGLALWGGNGSDKFVFSSGGAQNIRVMDFQADDADRIVLKDFADASFSQAIANHHIVQSGADVVIADGSGLVVTLQDISLASLHAKDFLFG